MTRARTQERRGSVRYTLVAAAFALTLAVALGGGGYIYFVLMHYERVAARHVPASAEFAVRLDAEQLAVFDPIRRHVFPVVDQLLAGPGEEAGGLERVERATKIELGRDAREVVVASDESGSQWAVVVGGMFPRGEFVRGLSGVLAEYGFELTADGRRLRGPRGLTVAQSADGCIVVASSTDWLEAALAGGGSELPRHHALALAATARALRHVGGPNLGPIDALRGTTELGTPLHVELELVTNRGDTPSDLAVVPQRLASWWGAPAPQRPSVTTDGPNRWVLHFDWDVGALEAVARSWASELRRRSGPSLPSGVDGSGGPKKP